MVASLPQLSPQAPLGLVLERQIVEHLERQGDAARLSGAPLLAGLALDLAAIWDPDA